MPSAAAERAERLAGVGVVCHLIRPSVEECVDLVRTAEEAGADWCFLPDVLGWPDVWMGLAAAASVTSRILLGPGVTNPYTRHPAVTVGALATLDRMSGGRAILGVGAGGTELTTVVGIDRSDSPDRVRDLVGMVRRSAAGRGQVPSALPVPDAPIIGGARGRRMLHAVAESCDVALVWGLSHEDLQSAAKVVAMRGAAVAWSPLAAADARWLPAALVYGVLNSPVRTRRRLGVHADLEDRLRRTVSERGPDAAAELLPLAAIPEFTVGDDPGEAAEVGRRLGARMVVVQAFHLPVLPDRIAWAREVQSRMQGPARSEVGS